MNVQPERIISLYEEIREEIRTTHAGMESQHCDYSFVQMRPSRDELSATHWKRVIANRMNFDWYYYDERSPFYAYFPNRPWLRLAYDIAIQDSRNSYEYRKNWLKILFPKLDLKVVSDRDEPQNYVNPITFKPSVGFGNTSVLFTNNIPEFVRFSQIKNMLRGTPGRSRVLHEYSSKFAECYIYVLSSRQLYYIFFDGEVELVKFANENKDKLQSDLYRLLGIPEGNLGADLYSTFGKTKSIPNADLCHSSGVVECTDISQLTEDARCFPVLHDKIEQVIVQNSGYPILDLRAYYISEDKTKIFSVASYFYTRDMMLKNSYNPHKFIPLKSIYFIYGKEHKNFDNYEDILSQVIYDDYKSIKPRPLSIAEYMVLVAKNSITLLFDGERYFVRARRLMIKVFLHKWGEMPVDIPRHFIVSLLNTLKNFSNIIANGDYASIKSMLNDWSKSIGTSQFLSIFSKHKYDFSQIMPKKEFEDLLRKFKKAEGKVHWHYSNIRQLHKLYSLLIKLKSVSGTLDQYNYLNVLISIMEARNSDEFTPYTEAIIVHGILNQVDLLQYFLSTETPYIQDIKRDILSKKSIRKAFVALLPTCSDVCGSVVKKILKTIDDTDGELYFSNRDKNLIKKLFQNYDAEVANKEFDHTQPQTSQRSAWAYLAKLLTGGGYFPDYLKLLCPSLLTYVDYATGRPISEFDLRHLIFSSDRRYLINLTHSLDIFEKTGEAFDCNAPQLRYLDRDELRKIYRAHSVYTKFYNDVQKCRSKHELLPFRFLIGLYRLVTRTNFSVQNCSRNYQLISRQERSEEYKLSRSIYGALMYVAGYVNISICLDGAIVRYLIDFRKNPVNNISGEIVNSELVNPILPVNIESGFTEKQNLEIIHLLRKRGELPAEYANTEEEVIDREYLILRRLVNSLSVQQRNFLNSVIIEVNGELNCFWEVSANARFDLKKANKYLLKFLCDFYPAFTYPRQVYWEYRDVVRVTKDAQPKRMADPNLDLDKILISLMTYRFVPPGSLPTGWSHCSFMDVRVKFPMHATLINVFDSFYDNYMGLTKDEPCTSQDELHVFDVDSSVDKTLEDEKPSKEDAKESVIKSVAVVDENPYRKDEAERKGVCTKKAKVTDKLKFQLEIFMEALNEGFEMYFDDCFMHKTGYFVAVYEWADWVISGEMFNDLSILESTEVFKITQLVKESGMSFSENVVLDFRTLTDIDITNREALARENRCVLNILCIKLFTKLSRQEFIRIFKALYPTLDLEILHKVLKLYLIAHNQMNLQNEHLINAVKKVLGLDIFALRCASPRSSFLVDMRSRLQITQQELHAAIYTMEVDFSLDQDNVVPLFDELESTLSSAPEF